MTMPGGGSVSLSQTAEAVDMLHQLKQHIEAVRQDFVVDEAPHSRVPFEVSTFHFRREMVVLERQVRHALIIAFGDASAEVRQYREVGFAHATAHGMEQCQLILDQSIAELEQRRLHVLEPTRVPQLGIDPTTDLYTEAILSRYLDHEIAWAQRHGESFALLLLRLPHCLGEASFARELVISAVSILKTRLRGYDLPFRMRESEFAAILRQANGLEVHQRALLITTDLRAAARRIRPQTEVPIEFTSAVYPYDAENITGLFAYANRHWLLVSAQSPDTVETSPSRKGLRVRKEACDRAGLQ